MEITKVEKIEVLEDSSAWQFVSGFALGIGIIAVFGC